MPDPERLSDSSQGEGQISLLVLCTHLLTLRTPELRTLGGIVIPQFQVLRDEARRVRELLADKEEFDRLDEAKEAIESGYYLFLSRLCLACWWLFREAEDYSHVKGLTKRQLEAIERAHQRSLDEIVLPAWIEAELKDRTHPRPRAPRRARSETDLPTKQMVLDVVSTVFEAEWKKFYPQSKTPPPTSVSKIWKDAGLDWLPKNTNKGEPHPSLPRRIATLRRFIDELDLNGG